MARSDRVKKTLEPTGTEDATDMASLGMAMDHGERREEEEVNIKRITRREKAMQRALQMSCFYSGVWMEGILLMRLRAGDNRSRGIM